MCLTRQRCFCDDFARVVLNMLHPAVVGSWDECFVESHCYVLVLLPLAPSFCPIISYAFNLKHIIRRQLTFFVEASGEDFLGRLSSRLAVQQHTRAAIASNRHSIFLVFS